tara:strand:- start:530 stop:754 length:225 start_codon:yes stop_codon:yes gene_type:complete
MSDYNPTNPAFDAILSTEMILQNMQPKKLESDATKGLVSKRKQTVSDAMADGRQRIAKYVKTIRDIREKNKKDA